MMRLLVADTPDGRSLAYLLDRTSLINCKDSMQNEQNLLQLNFRNLQPVKNAHGSLMIMSEEGWRKFARAINASFHVQSSDLIFWSNSGRH